MSTTTAAAKALTKVFLDLSDVIGGCGIRVTVANGSRTDITFNVSKKITSKEINQPFKNASASTHKCILEYT